MLATLIPTANAPTIGDEPTNAATAAAPKKLAVVISSILPLDFHNFSKNAHNSPMRNREPNKGKI